MEQRTNALCFEAERVRAELSNGERMWRILVANNLAMAAPVTTAGLPAIGFLTVTVGANPVAMVDELLTVFTGWGSGTYSRWSTRFGTNHSREIARRNVGAAANHEYAECCRGRWSSIARPMSDGASDGAERQLLPRFTGPRI